MTFAFRRHSWSLMAVTSVVAILASSLDAQKARQSIVVPAAAARVDGAAGEIFLLAGFERRVQLIVDRAQLSALRGSVIRRIAIRRDAATDAKLPKGVRGGWIDLTVRASWTKATPDQPSREFTRNHGRAPTTVYRGAYHVPDATPLGSGRQVASFAKNESAHIVLQTPLPWASSGNLCLEFVARPDATRPAPGPWFADVVVAAATPRTFFGHSCWRKKTIRSNFLNEDAAIGGRLVSWALGPETPLALFVLGASRTSWGPIPLPMDLTSIGAPGCMLYVSQDILIAQQTVRRRPRPYGTGRVELQLPFLRGLAGSRLFTQWIFLHRNANKAGLSVTNGASVVVGGAPGLRSAMITADRASAREGSASVGASLVMLLGNR